MRFPGSSSNIKEYNPGLWAKYYEENARDPSNKTLAPWGIVVRLQSVGFARVEEEHDDDVEYRRVAVAG